MADREASPIPLEIRARLAELELELSEGDITQKGYEKKRSKLIRAYFPHAGGMEGPLSHRAPLGPPSAARFHRRRTSGTRDERYRSDVHTEAVQAVLARHVERKVAVPMPSKRRSLVVQTSMDAYTPPENHTAPPDVTGYSSDASHPHPERHHMSNMGTIARNTQKYGNAERMETGDGVPVSSRVSAKIQQLVNTLKQPRRPPLREFFVDDFDELLEGWSISSCDAFLNVFQTKGLRADVICPCASSPEALTVAIRSAQHTLTLSGPVDSKGRPVEDSSQPPGRGVLSMQGLTYGVVRVDTEERLSVLTVQDVGTVTPGGLVCVVKPEGLPQLCQTDEIGEFCVCSVATGTSYYGLTGMTKNTFEVYPVGPSGGLVSDYAFVRTGLLGFIGPGGLVFITGKMDGLIMVSGRRHNADDIVATALAVEPMKFVYRGRIAVFSVTVLRDERIVVVAEQRPDSTEEDSFQWMSRVLQAIDSIHGVGVFCLALVPANTLPKTPLGGIHLSEIKQLYLEGGLHPCNVLMCPHTCVTNLPKPRQKQPEIGPASVMVGTLVSGKRIAQASGRDLGQTDDNDQFLFLSEVLQWRAQTTPDHILYTLLSSRGAVSSSLTCLQLHKRAERVAALLMERAGLQEGDHVALVYPPGIDLVAAFYGCLYAGCVPITVRPPHPQNISTTLPTVKMIVEVSHSACVMTTAVICKLLRSKEATATVDIRNWPPVLDTDDLPKKKPPALYKPTNPDGLAYLDFSVSTTGMLAGVQMSHNAVGAFCRSVKLQCELYPSREVAICLDPYCGLGFVLWCLCSVYSGHQSILIPPVELESNPALWLLAVSQLKVRDTFCSYSVMELCTKGLGLQTDALKARGLDLSRVRACVVVAEERPRMSLTHSFSKLFKDLGLHPRSVSTAFGCRVNLAICLQVNS
ncbi:disco-interacting protein 2 homolog C-like [Notothenia coriiceps]|uniref:Disco-interacting protein 2 homolog C-like n=1 Tax=Notothenia coriiceps TaxID=8208 RepID=A0A6I9Q163_9TELE|nr:PREDICTED: disco-interacting protein 2 homolog C-like [Notothenia coriiceps]